MKTTCLIICLLFALPSLAQNVKKPNVIMIVCHDIGQHLGCYGVEEVQTPNIDQLAAKGIRFENIYSTTPVCSPGRGSLHTGRYPQSNGLMGLTHAPWWWSLKDTEKHTAHLLKEAGYDTYLIGLQHLGKKAEELGYNHRLSPRNRATETVEEAVKLIGDYPKDGQPFFAKIGFFEVHRPFINGKDTTNGLFVPPYLQANPETLSDLADFQGTIQYFDESVGKILDALYASEIAENTLVVYTAEHGIPYPGAKWAARKAGIEIPLVIYQPQTFFSGGKTYKEIMSNVDILPTLLAYLGENIPNNIEGINFLPFLEGKADAPRKYAFAQYTPDMKRDNLSRTVITQDYQLIRYFDQGRAVSYPVSVDPVRFAAHLERSKTKGTRPFYQLYDLKADPYELQDIGQDPQHAEIIRELDNALYEWMKSVDDQLLEGPLKTPYYTKAIADFTQSAKK